MTNNIKAIRESRKLTQECVARSLGIAASSYSNKEAGRRPFTVKEVLKMEEIFMVSVRDMFKKECE